MRPQNNASKGNVKLFLKALPHLNKIGNKAVLKLSVRLGISVQRLHYHINKVKPINHDN